MTAEDDIWRMTTRMMRLPMEMGAMASNVLEQAMGPSASGLFRNLRENIGALIANAMQDQQPGESAGQMLAHLEETLTHLEEDNPDRLPLVEVRNRLHAWTLFQEGRTVPDLDDATIAALRAEGPDRFAWKMEGLAYNAQANGFKPVDYEGPWWAWLPLHTGAGLGEARTLLSTLPSDDTQAAVILADFYRKAVAVSKPAWPEAYFEALGLAVAVFFPHLHYRVQKLLLEAEGIDNQTAHALFYHGMGRGAYFAPFNYLPFTNEPERALAMCREHSPEPARFNSIAGLIWAVTLVNLGDPDVIHRYLLLLKETEWPAARFGVMGALTIHISYCGEDARLKALGAWCRDPLRQSIVGTAMEAVGNMVSPKFYEERPGRAFAYLGGEEAP